MIKVASKKIIYISTFLLNSKLNLKIIFFFKKIIFYLQICIHFRSIHFGILNFQHRKEIIIFRKGMVLTNIQQLVLAF